MSIRKRGRPTMGFQFSIACTAARVEIIIIKSKQPNIN